VTVTATSFLVANGTQLSGQAWSSPEPGGLAWFAPKDPQGPPERSSPSQARFYFQRVFPRLRGFKGFFRLLGRGWTWVQLNGSAVFY